MLEYESCYIIVRYYYKSLYSVERQYIAEMALVSMNKTYLLGTKYIFTQNDNIYIKSEYFNSVLLAEIIEYSLSFEEIYIAQIIKQVSSYSLKD